ncbi:nucleotidyltransferase family protein [Halobacillus locisalis]|uniref:Nucleotidyltransferase family protein n=1 Tax=Halobacillus locisalis TaxID=220753 RepID=A0A838CXY1_9BACI|nr:nucleotidyltransferase family protein [Halobacillus locisalis]MBA2176689.1 nucleotidyltransferase family protein [Halobacillus locisalis]
MSERRLIEIVDQHEDLQRLFEAADPLFDDYYIAAGCITQTVWNNLHGYDSTYGIKDADIVYFHNGSGTTLDEEKELESKLEQKLKDFPFEIDVKNEALVHLWYEKKFSQSIEPYMSLEDAIDTWPTTASAIGVKKVGGRYECYAPFGLDDLFSLIVRPNKRLVTEEVYRSKAERWKEKWPQLTIVPW